MTIEADAIPYEPSRLRGERLLVLAPHPDDEVIGCGGLVAQHLREGRGVRVIVATDGAQAGSASAREDESRRALAILGGADITFLRFPDRGLGPEVAAPLRDALSDYKPDLILAPSPIEIHPDHLALSVAFCELIQRDERLFAELAVARVAFYEVGQPLRPNAIADITDVAEAKYEAVAAHASQLGVRDYVAYTRGLNAYRAMTMPPETKYAEAYWVVALPELRTMSVASLQHALGDARSTAVVEETIPISVIVRTKDRPGLLREAIDSIRATGYPCEIVVVNDGGVPVYPERSEGSAEQPTMLAVPPVIPRSARDKVIFINHKTSRGRSEAMNSGVRAASSPFIAFLDDDDLYYPDHLSTLARAANGSSDAAWYTDAVNFFSASQSRMRLFGDDFDRDLLLADNYIPLPTLLVRRADFLDLGGFDPAFDLFEDWDFLIRLGGRGKFIHVPRVTVEIRHIESAGSITMATPEGSAGFRNAKKQIWAKHAALINHDVFAHALERQKRRLNQLQGDVVEQRGAAHHLQMDVARLEREKRELIANIQQLSDQAMHHALRIRELEGIDLALRQSREEHEQKAIVIDKLKTDYDEIRGAFNESQTTVQALYAEIHRLQGLLDMIYASRTWKLHTMVERVKGRG